MISPLRSLHNCRFVPSRPWEITKQTNYFKVGFWYQYLSKTRSYSVLRFIFEMILLAWFLKIVITLPISLTVLLIYGDPMVWQNPQQAEN